jgi:plasmid stabilization system protein ParE
VIEVFVAAQAELDLASAALFLAEVSPDAAARLFDDVAVALDRLAAFPGIGHLHPDLVELSLSVYRVGNWYLVYDATSVPLVIQRFVHTSRSLREV